MKTDAQVYSKGMTNTGTATTAQTAFIATLLAELATLGAPAEALAAYRAEVMDRRRASAVIRSLTILRDGARATARASA